MAAWLDSRSSPTTTMVATPASARALQHERAVVAEAHVLKVAVRIEQAHQVVAGSGTSSLR